MSTPLLALTHDWHRQRAQLRTGRMRPPPLVAAGLDVQFDAERGRSISLGGLAVIFGVFPASLPEFIELARARLHLASGQASELDPVLNTRILAMWAWLPTLRQDCYLELDRATGDEHLWTIGPGEGEHRELDPKEPPEQFSDAFLAALVLNGPGHWGGESGLQRLVERFGHHPMLVAAQIADLLDHQPRELTKSLEVAKSCWRTLTTNDETAWVGLAEQEHPWVNVQIGRLALRLGLVRAARVLLRYAAGTDVPPVAHFDLGQACEALGDLSASESAFARYAAAKPGDPDAWRRLLFCRLRLGHLAMVGETIKRYRAAGGRERDLAERFLSVASKVSLTGEQRAVLTGWLMSVIGEAILQRLPLRDLVSEVLSRRCHHPEHLAAFESILEQIRIDVLIAAGTVERGTEEALATIVIGMGFLVRPRVGSTADVEQLVGNAITALVTWARSRLDGITVLPDGQHHQAIQALARLAAETLDQSSE